MNAHAQSISYEQSLKQHYAANAMRLGKVPAKKPIAVLQLVTSTYKAALVEKLRADAPLWEKAEIHFDDHVKRFQMHVANTRPTYKSYIAARCEEIGVPYADIVGASRKRFIVNVRHELMFEVWEKFEPSFPLLARVFGRLDHTTALAAVNRVKAQREGNYGKMEAAYLETASRLDPYTIRRDFLARDSLSTIAAKNHVGLPTLRRYIKEKGWKR